MPTSPEIANEFLKMEGALGRLTTKVDALVKAVDSHGDKIDDIRLKVSFVKRAIWVLGAMLAVIVLVATWYFSGRLSITVS